MRLNDIVILLDPVVQIGHWPAEMPALPLMGAREPGSWMAVNGDSTLADAGLFVAMLAKHAGADRQTGVAEAVALVVAEQSLVLAGGWGMILDRGSSSAPVTSASGRTATARRPRSLTTAAAWMGLVRGSQVSQSSRTD